MSFWPFFWTIVFASAIGFFALLAIVVTIGGALDIRQMFRALRAEAEALQNESPSSDPEA